MHRRRTLQTEHSIETAMNINSAVKPGFLMQSIDVLGDELRQEFVLMPKG
jgi:hypothetical protein